MGLLSLYWRVVRGRPRLFIGLACGLIAVVAIVRSKSNADAGAGRAVGAAFADVITPGDHLIGDGGKAIAAFARKAGIPFHAVPSPGKPTPEAPHLHINNVNAYHGRLKQWLNRFNGVATKNLPNYLGWRRALEAWGDKLEPPNWIKGAIGNGPYQQLTL